MRTSFLASSCAGRIGFLQSFLSWCRSFSITNTFLSPLSEQVLELVSKAVRIYSYQSIQPIRSQNFEYELLKAPYRTFLNTAAGKTTNTQLLIYNLPPSLTEYLSESSQKEASLIRSVLFSGINSPVNQVVITFDTSSNSFLGFDNSSDIIDFIKTNPTLLASLACATLAALSALDSKAAEQLLPATTQSDTVVLIGSGGREHALAVALSKSPLVKRVIVCPGNGGTQSEGGKISNAVDSDGNLITKQDNDTVLKLVKRVNANMVVVGPEQPLVDGIVDLLAVECPSLKIFGPSKAGAELEASKVRCILSHFFPL